MAKIVKINGKKILRAPSCKEARADAAKRENEKILQCNNVPLYRKTNEISEINSMSFVLKLLYDRKKVSFENFDKSTCFLFFFFLLWRGTR